MNPPSTDSMTGDHTGPFASAKSISLCLANPEQGKAAPVSGPPEQGQGQTVTITLPSTDDPPAGQTSPRLEVEISTSEGGKPEKGRQTGRKAGRPLVPTNPRILEAVIRLDAEGHPWPRIRDLLEPISRKYGGPYPLHVEQVRRLALKAAKVLGKKLVKRRGGRPWEYYRQIKRAGGRS
jgi:hypothetical protein